MEYIGHRNLSLNFTLYSRTVFADGCYVVTVYADENLKIKIHTECSRKLPTKYQFTASIESPGELSDMLFEMYTQEQKNTLDIALQKAREKISKKLISLALKGGIK